MSTTTDRLKDVSTDERIDDRDIRALTTPMTVIDNAGDVRDADDMYEVTTDSGSAYIVDLRTESCECPDHEYRGVRCKHIRRAAFESGRRAIPAWVDFEAVDDQLGEHIESGEPRVVATDGGVATADVDEREPTALDRFFEPHKVIGRDAEGRIHHYDATYDREYTFEDGGRVYVVGDDGLEHVEDLGGRDADEWIQFVNDEVCGWDSVYLLTVNPADLEDAGLGGDA